MGKVRETVWKGDRGEGTVFYRLDATGHRLSPNLYLSYRADRHEHVVSAMSGDLEEAKRELKRLIRNRENAREGKEALITPKAERKRVVELLDENLRRAEERGLASLSQIRYRTETLKRLFGNVRAVDLRPEHVDQYKKVRREEGTGDTSIRRELEILTRAFRYAVERGILRYAPFVEKPTEDHVRSEKLRLKAWSAVLEEMGKRCADSRDFAEFFILTARRPKTIRQIKWDDFDEKGFEIRMPSAKGGNAANFPMEGLLGDVFRRRIAARHLGCPFIFHHKGRAISEERVRRIFREALEELGIPYGRGEGRFTFYSGKHTALSEGRDAGLSELELMDLSGHKTRSAFSRYVIEDTTRRRENLRKRDDLFRQRFADVSDRESDKGVGFANARPKAD